MRKLGNTQPHTSVTLGAVPEVHRKNVKFEPEEDAALLDMAARGFNGGEMSRMLFRKFGKYHTRPACHARLKILNERSTDASES